MTDRLPRYSRTDAAGCRVLRDPRYSDTTDTQQNLLLQTVLPVTTIESVRDGLIELRVHLVVGIEQIELHTTHVHAPYISMNLIVGVRHIDHQRITILIKLTLDRQRAEVLSLVVGNLLSVHRKTLCEIAETIQETNGTHVNVRVGSLFHVVASEHTQTTRIDFQGRVDTILHTEVSHRGALAIGLHVHILTEHVVNALDALHQRLILQDFLLTLIAQTLKKHHGVVLHIMVKLRVKVTEQVTSLEVPHPPHIVGNLIQTLQFLRKGGLDGQNLPRGSICVISFNFHILSIYDFFLIVYFNACLRASAFVRAIS